MLPQGLSDSLCPEISELCQQAFPGTGAVRRGEIRKGAGAGIAHPCEGQGKTCARKRSMHARVQQVEARMASGMPRHRPERPPPGKGAPQHGALAPLCSSPWTSWISVIRTVFKTGFLNWEKINTSRPNPKHLNFRSQATLTAGAEVHHGIAACGRPSAYHCA